MQVVKRTGEREDVSFDKVLRRLQNQSAGLKAVNVFVIAQKVCAYIHEGVTTKELDVTAANICSSMIADHPDHDSLAARLTVSNLQKETPSNFSDAIARLHSGKRVSDELYEIVSEHAELLDSTIDRSRDYKFDYFGIITLMRNYLIKDESGIVESPQFMFMRVSLGIHGHDIESAIDTYHMMSNKYMVHATPTLFNSGTNRAQMSSCYLIDIFEDSIDGIYDTLKECALISKYAGGIGLSISNIRAKGSYIKGTNGESSGLVPMARVFNATARYVNQGGKRKGAIAMYLEPWHDDIDEFINLRRNGGHTEDRARDLFLALWVPDLFMRRVEEGGMWSLMCPDESPGLTEVYGKDFDTLYEKYENEGKYRRQVPASELFGRIVDAQIETGTPYILFKDAANSKSNQKNLGCIKSSNLCAEIIEYTSSDEVAVCNLASICLPQMVDIDDEGVATVNYSRLRMVTRQLVINLNKIIDRNFYPTAKTKNSNLKHRPIGIGVQGLADVFTAMGVSFDSSESFEIERTIFRVMYYQAMSTSIDLGMKLGKYDSFEGSPLSEGILQPDLWENSDVDRDCSQLTSADWEDLRIRAKTHGARNSLLIALMPTASTSHILGSAGECMEPYSALMYTRKTLAGEFIVVNKKLVKMLEERGLWSPEIKQAIIINEGSIQGIDQIPGDIQSLFQTVWDLKQKVLLQHARNRAVYVCQSQSMNVFMEAPTRGKVKAMLTWAWNAGLKTGSYYLRSRPVAKAQQFTIEPKDMSKKTGETPDKNLIEEPVAEEEPFVCIPCSS
jgi:ribonucleoside-diphosphate reductase alpha chain